MHTHAQVLRLGSEMADALAYLHGSRIAHRDLKASGVGGACVCLCV